jgi:iron complex outermembrane receptor protein
MRFFLGTICLFLALSLNAQYTLKGKITTKGKSAVEGAIVTITPGDDGFVIFRTAADGLYEFTVKKPGNYELLINEIGSKQKKVAVTISAKETIIDVELEEAMYFLQPLEIKAVRAGERAPFAKQTISKEEIAKNNLGQDLPFILNQTPSVVINSDAGNGVGYTGIRIRGTDASRINVTLNGIPFNDAESQGTFFVDLPDFASSVNSIQIQRGVGTSSNGVGAFGATIALSTNEFNEKAYGELNNSYGSFNTWKHTVKAGSGLINNHFTIDARASKISSDGYVDRASSNLKSFYLSGAYITKRSSFRLNVFSGNATTYQSWYGIDSTTLSVHRTYNPAGTEKPGEPYDNQTDNYQQDHYQLFFNHSINNNWSFNTAAFLVNGKGYYEQYRNDENFSSYDLPDLTIGSTTFTSTDLVRQLWLDNAFYGQLAGVNYKTSNTQVVFGGGWSTYDGQHFGKVIWAEMGFQKDHKWYNPSGFKKRCKRLCKVAAKAE